jgi:hypothetical protein
MDQKIFDQIHPKLGAKRILGVALQKGTEEKSYLKKGGNIRFI